MSLCLLCLHSNKFYHGDIKPTNILVIKNNFGELIYYLTDYGTGELIEN